MGVVEYEVVDLWCCLVCLLPLLAVVFCIVQYGVTLTPHYQDSILIGNKYNAPTLIAVGWPLLE